MDQTSVNTTTKTKALRPIDEVRGSLEKMAPQFKVALPSHIPVERFMRVAQTAVGSNPGLLKADRNSLFSACMQSAQQGLLPDGKESALVMFGDKVTFMPMIGGILKKIRNSGELATIVAEIVYEKDIFEYWIDSDGQHMNHRPSMFGDRGKAIGTYAMAKTKDGAIYIEVMTTEQVMAVKKVSRSGSSGPWAGEFQWEMWKKTVLRRLAKRLPSSTDLDMTISADDELYDLKQTDEVTQPEPSVKKRSRLSKLMDQPETVDVTPEPPQLTPDEELPI